MFVDPLAADSLGVRSSAVLIGCDDTRVLIDPGTGLGWHPGQPRPHPVEYQALQSAAGRIDQAAKRSDAVVITHYHYDHYVPLEENYRGLWSSPARARGVYAEKHVMVKKPADHINQSQKARAKELRPVFDGVAARLTAADEQVRKVGDLTLRFSPPVPHGIAGSHLGWVIMLAVEGPDETVVYTSDVQGPTETETTAWILAQDPDLVIVDGPSLYPDGSRTSDHAAAQENLRQLAGAADLIIDHHMYRIRDPTDFLRPIKETAAEVGHTVQSAASYRGEPRLEYETVREQLHSWHPVKRSFYDRVHRGTFANEPIRWQDWAS